MKASAPTTFRQSSYPAHKHRYAEIKLSVATQNIIFVKKSIQNTKIGQNTHEVHFVSNYNCKKKMIIYTAVSIELNIVRNDKIYMIFEVGGRRKLSSVRPTSMSIFEFILSTIKHKYKRYHCGSRVIGTMTLRPETVGRFVLPAPSARNPITERCDTRRRRS